MTTGPDKLRLDYALTPDDVAAFYTAAVRNRPRKTVRRRLGPLGARLLIGLIFVASLTAAAAGDQRELLMIIGGTLVGGFLLGLLYIRLFVSLHARAMVALPEYRHMYTPKTLEVSPDGVHWFDALFGIKAAWPAVIDILVTPRAIYLLYTPDASCVIPRRVFGDEASFRAFADRLRTWHRQFGTAEA